MSYCDNWGIISKAVRIRDGGLCRKCGTKIELTELSAHHIIPRRKSFNDSLTNLVSLCPKCHKIADKYGLTQYARNWIKENEEIDLRELGSRFPSLMGIKENENYDRKNNL